MQRRTSDALFLAIAHPARRTLLMALLTDGELTAGELQSRVDLQPSALSQHLSVLLQAELVAVRKDGRHRRYRLTPDPLLDVISWMNDFQRLWRDLPDRLGAHLDAGDGATSGSDDRRPVTAPNEDRGGQSWT